MDEAFKRSERRGGKHIGWTLLVALIVAVSVAISLAVQLDEPGRSTPRATPPCGGLYEQCCEDWDDNWGPCINECDAEDDLVIHERDDGDDRREGLFDAEENFADRRLPRRC